MTFNDIRERNRLQGEHDDKEQQNGFVLMQKPFSGAIHRFCRIEGVFYSDQEDQQTKYKKRGEGYLKNKRNDHCGDKGKSFEHLFVIELPYARKKR